MNIKQQFKEGLITNNPVLVQLIGMCATMAITTSLFNGIGMGLSVLIILTCCNVVISLIRKVIPNDIRLAIFVLVIASFVTIVDLVLQAYVPALSASLGVFIPLIVVNCIIIGRAEAFCQKNPVGPSFFDGIFQGLGYTLVLIAMCVIRELLGKGSFGTSSTPSTVSSAPATAFRSSVRVRRARAHAPDRRLHYPRLPDRADAVRAAQVRREEGSQGKSARSAGKGGGIT